MPAGLDDTEPLPVPVALTVRLTLCIRNVAVTERAAVIVTEHAPLPLQSPDQPPKVDPVPGAAASLSVVP
jgi:hypothetical protein